MKIYESELYLPIKEYLILNGYEVKAEVNDCDIVAVKDDELLIIEMKKSLNLTLLLQANERKKITDTVYIAIPKLKKSKKSLSKEINLLKKLELGLMYVDLEKITQKIELVLHPTHFVEKKNNKKKIKILEEIKSRTGDYNIGGINKKPIITAYREQGIFIACCLDKFGPLNTKKLKEFGTNDKTYSILYNDHYGWFEKIGKGVYKLTSKGEEGIKKYSEIAEVFYNKINLLNKIDISGGENEKNI